MEALVWIGGPIVVKAKKAWLDNRAISRADDPSLANLLVSRARWDRRVIWDETLEEAVAALARAQVSEAFHRHVDPAAPSIVKSGDIRKTWAYR